MLAVEISDQLQPELEKWSRETGRSESVLVNEALAAHLEELEDIRVAKERLANPGERFSLDQMEQELALED